METKRQMGNENCALWLLKESTKDRVLKNAITRAIGETPLFEVGDEVIISYDGEYNGCATITRRYFTKNGARYAICLKHCTGEIEGFSGDDMELNDRTAYNEWKKRHLDKSNK